MVNDEAAIAEPTAKGLSVSSSAATGTPPGGVQPQQVYLLRRIAQSTSLAESSSSDTARAAHLAMLKQYRAQMASLPPNPATMDTTTQ